MENTLTMIRPMITVSDVARILGVSEDTVYRLKDKPDGIPAYRLGRSIRFRPEEVEAYIAARGVKPVVKEERMPNMKRFKYVPGMKVV